MEPTKTERTTDFLEFIKNFLLQNYQPATDPAQALMMSTTDVFNAVQRLYPSESYRPEDIALWLHDGGFKFYDVGSLRFEWLMQALS